MRDPLTHGPLYRTTSRIYAIAAWEADVEQWIMTDGTAYLVGYVPAIFQYAPMAQGWRLTSPEELWPA